MSTRLLSVMLLALAACATVSPEGQIRDLEQQQVHAAIARDRGTLEKIFAPDFRIINPSGAVASKDELLNLLTAGTSPYRSAVYETQTVNVYGNVVVTTGLETVVPAQGAQAGQNVQRRITHVWEKSGKDWKLKLRHATIVTPPPAAPPAPR
jgi:uncharacterized protein (TIGR02246 family)